VVDKSELFKKTKKEFQVMKNVSIYLCFGFF